MIYPGLFDLIVVFSDNIPSHDSQSSAVSHELAKLTGASVVTFSVPHLTGARRFFADKRKLQLTVGRKEEALSWLNYAGGGEVLRMLGKKFSEKNIREHSSKALLIASADTPAAYCLACAIVWKAACVVVGTPKAIGTRLFDFAIVPEYEYPRADENILKTVLPPNGISKDELSNAALELERSCRPKSQRVWGMLVGGSSKDYAMTPPLLKEIMKKLIIRAEQLDADIYVTVSRATSDACIAVLKQLVAKNDVIRYLNCDREKQATAERAIIGLADELLCTEDAIDMLSEAITGGHKVVLLRLGKLSLARRAGRKLIAAGALPSLCATGALKYDLVYDRLKRHDKVIEFHDWLKSCKAGSAICGNLPDDGAVWRDFNEARRAALWIAKSWAG